MEIIIKGSSPAGRMIKRLEEDQKQFWREIRNELEDEVKAGAMPHYRTGRMHRNIYSRIIPNGVEAGIHDNGMMTTSKGKRTNYAAYVLYGTRRHYVKPTKKKVLRWVGPNGRFAFSKGHWVKGITADNFLQKAGEKVYRIAIEKLKRRYG